MAKTKFNAATMAANWQSGMQSKAANWASGCAGTSSDIGTAARAKSAQAQANYQKALNPGGSWDTAMANFSMPTWKTQCANAAKMGRFAQGATKGLPKMQRFASLVGPYYANMRQVADATTGWQQKVVAAIQILVDAGKKNGGNVFA